MKKVNLAISLWNLSNFDLGKEARFGPTKKFLQVYSLESLRSLKSLDERRLVAVVVITSVYLLLNDFIES